MRSKSGASPEKVLIIKKWLKGMQQFFTALGTLTFADVINGALFIGQLFEDVAIFELVLVRQLRCLWTMRKGYWPGLRLIWMRASTNHILIGVHNKCLIEGIDAGAWVLRRELIIVNLIMSKILIEQMGSWSSSAHGDRFKYYRMDNWSLN